MRFEYKTVAIFGALIIVWMLAVNVFILTFFKYCELQKLRNQAQLYLYMKLTQPSTSLPSFVKLTQKPVKLKDYELFERLGGYYVYFKKGYTGVHTRRFAVALVIWEIALSAMLVFMIYYVMKHLLEKDKEYRDFLKFLIGTISHKMGNFLSIQKLNLELIKTEDEKPLGRLKEAYSFMEKDFKNILQLIRDAESKEIRIENVEEVIRGALELFSEALEGKKVELSLQRAYVKSKDSDFSNLLHELIDNAVKYSEEYISIVCTRRRKVLYIEIENDIAKRKRGSGFGLELARYLSMRNGWYFSTDVAGGKFKATLIVHL